jgi:hypothetical protein
MTIHHINCGTLNPLFPPNTQSILYCLLVETNSGLLLVDSGFGVKDYVNPTLFIRVFTRLLGMDMNLDETAVRRVEALGYHRTDVRHIALTHLHCIIPGDYVTSPVLRFMCLRTSTTLLCGVREFSADSTNLPIGTMALTGAFTTRKRSLIGLGLIASALMRLVILMCALSSCLDTPKVIVA